MCQNWGVPQCKERGNALIRKKMRKMRENARNAVRPPPPPCSAGSLVGCITRAAHLGDGVTRDGELPPPRGERGSSGADQQQDGGRGGARAEGSRRQRRRRVQGGWVAAAPLQHVLDLEGGTLWERGSQAALVSQVTGLAVTSHRSQVTHMWVTRPV